MRGIYFDGSNAVYRDDLPKPMPRGRESLVRVLMAAVCNTDKEILRGYRPDFKGVMGHEFVGVVEQSPEPLLIGKRVVGELNEACGKCIYCTTGRPTHCSSRKVLGIDGKDGCFAEYMTIDTALLHEVPDKLKTEDAIYTEPLAAAFEILTQVRPGPEQNIGILGDGRLAFCIAQALHASGYPFTVIGKHRSKLKLFAPYGETIMRRMGKKYSMEEEQFMEEEHAMEEEHSKGQKGLPLKEGYEIIIEATGSAGGIRQALSLVRKKGTIVLKSTYAGEVSLPLSMVAVNEITIIGSRCGPFEPAIRALEEGKAVFPAIELYDLQDYEKAFTSKGFKTGFVFLCRWSIRLHEA